jgi:hypothetical protein
MAPLGGAVGAVGVDGVLEMGDRLAQPGWVQAAGGGHQGRVGGLSTWSAGAPLAVEAVGQSPQLRDPFGPGGL